MSMPLPVHLNLLHLKDNLFQLKCLEILLLKLGAVCPPNTINIKCPGFGVHGQQLSAKKKIFICKNKIHS